MPDRKVLRLPLAFTLALMALAFLPQVRQNAKVFWAFVGIAGALGVWNLLITKIAGRRGRTLTLDVVLRKQHYVQACVQGALLAYWGWYWPQVYAMAPFILAQLIFAYAFDMLLCWSRRDSYSFGFSPFP